VAQVRVQILVYAAAGLSAEDVAELLGCDRSHVYRTVARFGAFSRREELLDGRRSAGRRKATAAVDKTVGELLAGSPQDFRYPRPTWTRELLVKVTEQQTRVRVSVTTMTRVLYRIGARRGRPKPTVNCPLSARQKRRRLSELRRLVTELPDDEVAVYEDEADVHLNPKIGLDWMARGVQKEVLTPGKNEKAYIAGTLDVRDGTVLWVGAEQKNSALFVQMLQRLQAHYEKARVIHVICDNYAIHDSGATRAALRQLPRIRLHFLPPYCPDHNRIERLWQDLHANVTRNHRHASLLSLCSAVAEWLDAATPWPSSKRAGEPKRTGPLGASSATGLAQPGQGGAQPGQEPDDRARFAA
jgi:transposase